MGFELQLEDDAPWLSVGGWFAGFVQLAQKLHAANAAGQGVRRVLIAVPQSEMVSLGLATGFSRASFLSGRNGADPIELDDITVGDVIQVRSSWQETPPTLRAPEDRVGYVVSRDDLSKSEVRVTLRFRDSRQLPVSITRARCPIGEKDPAKHIRVFRVPDFLPKRSGTKREFPYRDIKKDHGQRWISKWETWEYQVDPTLAIFGSPTKVKNYGSPMFRDPQLHQMLLEIEHDSLLNVARVDYLDADQKPHLVNVIGQISAFPKKGTQLFDLVSAFPFVCLDGNAAMVSLSDRPLLDDKCVIGLWETSKPNLQDQALTTFLSSATRYSAIDDLERMIDWQAPPGVQCWGWR